MDRWMDRNWFASFGANKQKETPLKCVCISHRFSRVHQPQWASPACKQSSQLLHWSHSATFTLSICAAQDMKHTHALIQYIRWKQRVYFPSVHAGLLTESYSWVVVFLWKKNVKNYSALWNANLSYIYLFCLLLIWIFLGFGWLI